MSDIFLNRRAASANTQLLSEHNHGIPSNSFRCGSGTSMRGSKNEIIVPVPPRRITNRIEMSAMKETENFLAAEMNKLSTEEISNALEDVHCVGQGLDESPAMVERSLLAFDEAVKAERNYIYELAARQDKGYVEDGQFRLKFLRANLYDIKRSVKQMMNFLKHKATYFGADKVGRDIVLSDLNQADLDLMRSGVFHIQNGRDKSGRVVVYMLNHMLYKCEVDTMIRVTYYIFYNLLVSLPEVQTKGLSGVYYDTAKPGEKFIQLGFNAQMTILAVTASIPFRHSSMHMCLKGKGNLVLNNAVIGIMMNAFPRYARVRTRLHYGSDTELRYQLQSHGISLETCPVDWRGEARPEVLNLWYEDHLAQIESIDHSENEEINDASSGSESTGNSIFSTTTATRTPTVRPTDVLLGRGKGYQNHPGNIQFRECLQDYCDNYDEAHRHKRRRIARDVAQILTETGVRFLKLNGNMEWIESDHVTVEDKITQLFRTLRKNKRCRQL